MFIAWPVCLNINLDIFVLQFLDSSSPIESLGQEFTSWIENNHQGLLLLTWTNFNPHMDK